MKQFRTLYIINKMPRRGPELSSQLRARICELRSIGWSYDRIQKKHPEVPRSTIRYTCQKEVVRLNNHSISRPGAPTRYFRDPARRNIRCYSINSCYFLRGTPSSGCPGRVNTVYKKTPPRDEYTQVGTT
jgi:hypothetical protein